ncbi:MAG: c-type cytochrome [Gammaproteobacteria bacterium]|nr:MAG: c-type cytochrome [Gammaproteobacteria bacterium]
MTAWCLIRRLYTFTPAEANGEQVFIDKKCGRCHTSQGVNPVGASFVDNGLGSITMDPLDNGKFRNPTLRNVEITAPYMHNGVFNTLEEVVEFYNSRLASNAEVTANVDNDGIGNLMLTQGQMDDLVAFLKTLTDQ